MTYAYNISDLKPTKSVVVKQKLLLLIANTYNNTELELGEPILNDCRLMTKCVCKHGYQALMLLDSNCKTAIEWLVLLSTLELDDIIIYYSGHGTLVEDKDQGELKEMFEAMSNDIPELKHMNLHKDEPKDSSYVFYNYTTHKAELLVDDIFTQIISTFKTKPLIVSDCCHSGTIIDLPLLVNTPNHNIEFISACCDWQYAIQSSDNGLFTKHLCKYIHYLDLDDVINTFNRGITDTIGQKNDTNLIQHAIINCNRKKLWK